MRAEAADLSAPGAPKSVVYLYVAKDGRIVPIEPATGPVISAATIAAVEGRARAAGRRRRPGAISVTPLRSTQAFGKWTCEAWAVRRPGQTTEIVCLADPKALGVDETTRASLRGMSALLVPFVNAMRLAGGDARESADAYALEGGFPVRTFRSKDGVVELDAQLVSVETADLPADLFKAPAPPGPAAAPSPPPAAAPAPDRTITLEGWALRGMPDAGRAWTGADYDAAASLLEGVAKEDASRLPREASAASGALYRRFVDPENLAPARGKGSVDARAKAGAGVLAGVDRISVVYAGAYRDDASRGSELAAPDGLHASRGARGRPARRRRRRRLAEEGPAPRHARRKPAPNARGARVRRERLSREPRDAGGLPLRRAPAPRARPRRARSPAEGIPPRGRPQGPAGAPEEDVRGGDGPAVRASLDRARAALSRRGAKAA